MQRLDEKYRPKTLAEVYGQGAIVDRLSEFIDAPCSTAMLFEGPTGVGKTSVAHALARDLGVEVDWGPYGGWYVISSGNQKADDVRETMRQIGHTPMMGSGWRVVLVDEADMMSPAVRFLWLSQLEDLPPRTLIIFTTNNVKAFEDRFLDRIERFNFQSDGKLLLQDAQTLSDWIWEQETGRKDAPRVDPKVANADGKISFRRVVMSLVGPLRQVPRIVRPEKKAQRCDLLGNKLPNHTPDPTPEIRFLAPEAATEPSFQLKPPPQPAPTLWSTIQFQGRDPYAVQYDPKSRTMKVKRA